MEISNNQNIYTNYQKTKKEDSVLPIEVFKIDKNNIVENPNKFIQNDEKEEQEYVYIGTIYENIKKGIDKNAHDILIENFKKSTKEYNESKNILNQYLKP